MIKCEHLQKTEINQIAHYLADTFLAEEGSFKALPYLDAVKMFEIIVDVCSSLGHFYTTSNKMEGFCARWTKEERPSIWVQINMAFRMLFKLSFKANMMLLKNQIEWTATEDRYKKNDNFVEVFLLAIRKEYQHQGFFREMLTDSFNLADSLNTICVLDTDSSLKAEKYQHLGMRIVEQRTQKSGTTMYAMER